MASNTFVTVAALFSHHVAHLATATKLALIKIEYEQKLNTRNQFL